MPANLPYPLQFDPSQLKDPYSRWAGVALPFDMPEIGASGTFGNQVPTNALGQPIQSYTDAASAAQATYQQQMADYQKALAAYNSGTPGTTINNTGGSGAAPQTANYSNLGPTGSAVSQIENSYLASPGGQAAAANPNAALINYARSQNQALLSSPSSLNQGGFGAGNNVLNGSAQAQLAGNLGQIQLLQQAAGAPAGPAGPAPPTPPSQPNMTQAYIAALQSPGHVTSPGANVPEAPAPSQQSNVLQQFLANWQQGGGKTTGAGNYNNKGFFDALQGNV
jgi:hypothetical protein